MSIELKSHHLHVWHAGLAPLEPSAVFVEKLLSLDERNRAARFHFNIHRTRYIYSHACLRLLISAYVQIPPEKVIFDHGPYGKPFIAGQPLQTLSANKLLNFNISHSADLAVFGFAWNAHLGIDTEFINRDLKIDEIAPTVFTSRELASLYSAPLNARSQHFFELWSRKEAYAKALGMGLQLPFKELEIGQRDCIDGLRIQSFEPASGYTGAVAAPLDVDHVQYSKFDFADFL